MSNRKLSKKARSNALRLAALQEKEQQRPSALKIPKEASVRPGHHAVFAEQSEDKVTLFDSDDDGDVLGERFSGPGGERLLQLQRRIGLDQRFKLDNTFLESSETEVTKEEAEDERSRSLAVLDSLFGPSTVTTTTRTEVVIPPRYDPLSATPTLHEQPMEVAKNEETSDESEGEAPPDVRPIVSDNTYYTINTDLCGLFADDNEGSKFSFLPPEVSNEVNSIAEEKVGVAKKEQRPIRVEHEVMEVIQEERMFFHHSDAVVDHTFHRSDELQCLEERWMDKRAALKHAFRKRHREATKTFTKVRKH